MSGLTGAKDNVSLIRVKGRFSGHSSFSSVPVLISKILHLVDTAAKFIPWRLSPVSHESNFGYFTANLFSNNRIPPYGPNSSVLPSPRQHSICAHRRPTAFPSPSRLFQEPLFLQQPFHPSR